MHARRPFQKHVVAAWAISLVVVGAGTAQAAIMITGKQIKNGTVGFVDLDRPLKGTILAGHEVAAKGLANSTGGGITVVARNTYNAVGGKVTATHPAQGVYVIAVPGLERFASLNPTVSLITASPFTAGVTKVGSQLTVRVFDPSGVAADLPRGDGISFLLA